MKDYTIKSHEGIKFYFINANYIFGAALVVIQLQFCNFGLCSRRKCSIKDAWACLLDHKSCDSHPGRSAFQTVCLTIQLSNIQIPRKLKPHPQSLNLSRQWVASTSTRKEASPQVSLVITNNSPHNHVSKPKAEIPISDEVLFNIDRSSIAPWRDMSLEFRNCK